MSVCLSVRPSVRPSHAGIESKWLYISSKFFYHPVATPFWFSHTKQDGDIPTENSLTGRRMKGGYEKNHDFRPIFRFIWQMMQDRAIVTMEGKQETAPKLSNGTSLNDLE